MSKASKRWLFVVGIVLAISGPFQCYLMLKSSAGMVDTREGVSTFFNSPIWNIAKALSGFIGGIGIVIRVRAGLFLGIMFVAMVALEFLVSFSESVFGSLTGTLPWFHRLVTFGVWLLMLIFLTRKSVLEHFKKPGPDKSAMDKPDPAAS